MDETIRQIIAFIRQIFRTQGFIPLHEPRFIGREKECVLQTIESTFVSSVGSLVEKFEQKIAQYTQSPYAIATVNGTSALHLALKVAGVGYDDEVITQALTFVATANAIRYLGAHPIFLDVLPETMSLSPDCVRDFLVKHAEVKSINGKKVCYNKLTGRRISACVPVHTLGHPARIDELLQICQEFGIPLVEDAAESLGTFYKGKHTGTWGLLGVVSFNGNKIITTGNGGVILTADEHLAMQARHLSTQAKKSHPWEYVHDQIGYNYRLTNIQAALGLAQIENIDFFVQRKRWLASKYREFFDGIEDVEFFSEPLQSRSNYWLNAILVNDLNFREKFLKLTNTQGVMTRPLWRPLHMLRMYKGYSFKNLKITEQLYERVVCLPSSVILPKE